MGAFREERKMMRLRALQTIFDKMKRAPAITDIINIPRIEAGPP
jgi:hypothetical protein